MITPDFTPASLKDRPDLIAPVKEICAAAWPEFMNHDEIVGEYWWQLYENYLEYQFALLEPGSGKIAAVGNCIPMERRVVPGQLDDGGLDWILREVCEGKPGGRLSGRTLFALQIISAPNWRGKAVSTKTVQHMIAIGKAHKCTSLYAPVRPNRKSLYPLTPMERYVNWKTREGMPFDPWMRVHVRLGAEVVKVCPESMYMSGTVAEWESWTGLLFPESGQYVISGALVPILIDLANDIGMYLEPNVWMHHRIE
ncbi:MAG: GNAT family N-acetyltransferase [candidate division Zixibacteria bacterium]|nr:GNAT family N-acetyltransferase [candidate division Zixibacteria bacterium]